MDERVAQYLRLDSCLFQTTVRGSCYRQRHKFLNSVIEFTTKNLPSNIHVIHAAFEFMTHGQNDRRPTRSGQRETMGEGEEGG